MIINIRGTHGSGKSTIVKKIITENASEVIGLPNKPEGYRVVIPWLERPLFVVGSYRTSCGGCDGIQPYTLIWPRVVDYATKGHVLFEGALVSSSYGNIGRASEVFGDQFVFAFMDTPLTECLRRISERRKARGDARPLNPKNTTSKYNGVLRSIEIIRDREKRRVVMIDHRRALSDVLLLLHKDQES